MLSIFSGGGALSWNNPQSFMSLNKEIESKSYFSHSLSISHKIFSDVSFTIYISLFFMNLSLSHMIFQNLTIYLSIYLACWYCFFSTCTQIESLSVSAYLYH